MAADIEAITVRNPVDKLSDRQIAEETLLHLRELTAQLAAWQPILSNLKLHGLMGLRRGRRDAG